MRPPPANRAAINKAQEALNTATGTLASAVHHQQQQHPHSKLRSDGARLDSAPPSPTTSVASATTTNANGNGLNDALAPLNGASAASSANGTSSTSSRGQIHVKVLSARGLNVQSPRARPYVVVQFEQNEFISRDPIEETEKEIKGTAVPTGTVSRVGSATALSALAAINSKSHGLAMKSAAASGKKDKDKDGGAGSAPSSAGTGTSSRTSSGSSTASRRSGLEMSLGRMPAHNPVWKHEVSFDVTSEQSYITFTVYDRAVEDHFFLGRVQIKPVLKHDHTVDQWYKLQATGDEAVTGEMRIQVRFEQFKNKRALTPRDFEFLKLIGRGTFGRVFQVRKKDTKRIYAMKVLSKKEIVAKKEVAHTIGERKILQRSLECPFLVGLKFSFQTEVDLYLVTDFKSGGELFWHLQRETRFSEERARFYIAELILALEHLHKYDIVYRDLKPENILLDATGHVALCDFGLSKADLRSDELTNTFCGTTEYLAPEVLLDEHGYSKLVDFWSLGVLLFEMCCGWSPFYAEDTQQMYRNICFGKIRFPKGVICEDGKMFVKGLLNRNPKHRLGAQRDAAELKEHPFFKSIDWRALALKQVTPPFKPIVESDESVANFDNEFTSVDVREMVDGEAWDEDDPSEAWTSPSSLTPGSHTPNGPLGSDLGSRPSSAAARTPAAPAPAPTPAAAAAAPTQKANGAGPNVIEIKSTKRRAREAATSPPLTSSVQEQFTGFTFSGGESFVGGRERHEADAAAAEDEDEQAVEDEDGNEPTTEDEAWDDERHAGRYANARRKGALDGLDDVDPEL
ncbi:Pkinase-domain-containing protein [Punctularia strigosozonata HHB-11173 SS5]|uniref:Pkinase-domain-containing protein n=1 Tax=Punctularia strigosozonata (strain HHB-11173) TaxID=741275 RepID=UPI0004417FB8|nr:Pkinase-domain-containing protein [Punctularia strigosozonata HHB-11173 SS5]EIN10280.1 Pkinase-domain-containing protein [Punctularia strigosozonata HHB-11173 SS5]